MTVQSTNMFSSGVAARKMFTSPPIELLNGQVAAIQALHHDAHQLYYVPLSNTRGRNTGKLPTKQRLRTLHHILTHHRSALAMFLSHEFTAPLALIAKYGELYVKVPVSMYFYAQLVDPELPNSLPHNHPDVGDALEEVNVAIHKPWRLAQKIVASLEKAQKRVGQLVGSLKESALWTDGIVAIENKRCGESWCSDLLKDVFVRLEELKLSYLPLIDYFNVQETHLRTLQGRVFDDSNAQLDALQVDPWAKDPSLPSCPMMSYPWQSVQERALAAIMEWRAFTPDSEAFTNLEPARLQFVEDIQAIPRDDGEDDRRRVSKRVRVAFSRISSLFHSSEINVY
ncbi:hypothetical protein AN958_02815 [Leucoagaricus sp. SymC.cos]|nr:hypothetical protein AN958_02815 [Leucoagaricus sp. SymC.cos]